MRSKYLANIFFGALAFIAGCAAPEKEILSPVLPEGFPQRFYQQAMTIPAQTVFQVDTQQSRARISVYRAGKLARLGHDHIIASHNIQGYALLDKNTGLYQADMFIPLALLTVDEPALRTEAGFDTQPSAADIEGTRQHMLEDVLEEKQFPFVQIHVTDWNPRDQQNIVKINLLLHGISKQVIVSIDTGEGNTEKNNNEINISGHFTVNQTDYAMKPYTVMGGLLQVKDAIDIEFRIIARAIGR